MSAIRWARTVRCDWPAECDQVATVDLTQDWPDVAMPAGWLNMAGVGLRGLQIIGPFGNRLNEFCPEHAAASLADLLAAIPEPVKS